MRFCYNCGTQLKDGAKFCGRCGQRTTAGLEPPTPSFNFASDATPAIQPVQYSIPSRPLPTQPIPTQPLTPATTLGGIFSRLKDGEAEQAGRELIRWWHALHWSIRVMVVTIALAALMMLMISQAGRVNLPALFFLVPFGLGAIIALARPEPALGRMERFVRWSAMKRERAKDKGTFVYLWFFRPLYASLCGSATVTGFIKEPYLRTGVIITLQFFTICIALVIAYAAIAVVIAFVALMIALWILSFALSDKSSSGSSVSSYAARRIARRSERRTGFFGNEYQQHYNDEGGKAGYTEQRTDFFGKPYQQHYSQQGDKSGYSEGRTGFLGDQYQQHFDQNGSKAGYSEQNQNFFGTQYVQHHDDQGNKTGRSEVRKDFFGREYVKHEDE